MKETLPFYYNKHKIKAIILGADPGNFSDHGKTVEINAAFAIGTGDSRYFDPILKNMNAIGLGLQDVYIQNIITFDPGVETTKNKEWEKIADQELPKRIAEFDDLDPSRQIPVLVTAERILRYLVDQKLPKAEQIYTDYQAIQVEIQTSNKLHRAVYPFFRNPKYRLTDKLWESFYVDLHKTFSTKK